MAYGSRVLQRMKPVETGPVSCGACSREAGQPPIETHHDRVSGIDYQIYVCSSCGISFSYPDREAGADWYAQAVPLEPSVPPEKDWRFSMFLMDRPGPGKLLDIGCGSGEFLRWARDKGYDSCVGFDYDARKTNLARASGIDAHTLDWKEFCSSRKEGEFGVATLFDVLEHVPRPRELLRETRRLLKPGGYLVITLPNARRPLPFGREGYDFPPHHFTRWTPPAMKGFLEKEGFSIVRQDASALPIRDFLETFVTHCAVAPTLSLAKKLLFSAKGTPDISVSEMFASDAPEGSKSRPRKWLAHKKLRSSLFGSFKALCRAILWMPAAAMVFYYRFRRKDCGNCLYTLAQKKAEGL